MGPAAFHRALVLGGIRSGKSEYGEQLVAAAPVVRYLATARRDPSDEEWEARIAAHQARRRGDWETVEVGDRPAALLELLTSADARDTLFVDDLGTWVASVM